MSEWSDLVRFPEEGRPMTDTYELPELPREHKRLGQVSETCSFGLDGMKVLETRDDSYPVYTADQMRAYGEACAKLERERCARFVEDEYERQFIRPWREDLAAAIRREADDEVSRTVQCKQCLAIMNEGNCCSAEGCPFGAIQHPSTRPRTVDEKTEAKR